jgi:hypothetical protein
MKTKQKQKKTQEGTLKSENRTGTKNWKLSWSVGRAIILSSKVTFKSSIIALLTVIKYCTRSWTGLAHGRALITPVLSTLAYYLLFAI